MVLLANETRGYEYLFIAPLDRIDVPEPYRSIHRPTCVKNLFVDLTIRESVYSEYRTMAIVEFEHAQMSRI
jgi:hypothetical protein